MTAIFDHRFRSAAGIAVAGLTALAITAPASAASHSAADTDAHWSFEIPTHPPLPDVADETWPESPIDHFILARLEAKGLEPVQDSARRPLLRRIYFDLIGLPPEPEAIEDFVHDPAPNAFEKVVDRLLASPRFGERWGRHWLDVARYAESSGKEFNFTYPHAWPYRNYVIDAFNADKAYHRFIREQLAGDLMPAATRSERDEQRLATGFLAIGEKRHNANRKTFEADRVDDQITATAKAFLGLTVDCARCHDHKFDPIPTEDYYRLAGIFRSTETLYGTTEKKYSRHPSGLVPYGPNAQALHKEYQQYRERLGEAKDRLEEAEKELEELKAEREKEKEKAESNGENEGESAPSGEAIARAEAQVKELEEEIEAIKADSPPPPQYAMGAREGEKPVKAQVAIGGNPHDKGAEVPRGFLSAIEFEGAPEIDPKASGRLALADWIAHPNNPLTARVLVNRVWHHLFGRGLVPTVDNFGALGQAPSHPQLLDYLATRFIEDNWSIKRLIRTVVGSRTYRLSTRHHEENARADPDNSLYWRMRPRRLEVEPLRDAILSASGRLDLQRPTGSSVTELGQQLARKVSYEKINPASYHRTVYLPVVRHYLPHMLQEFDFPATGLVSGERSETTVPAQALFLLNSDFVVDQARAMAKRLLGRELENERQRLTLAYQLTLSRPPTPDELAEASSYLSSSQEVLKPEHSDPGKRRLLAWAGLCQALFAGAEFRYLVGPATDPSSSSDPKAPQSQLDQESHYGESPR